MAGALYVAAQAQSVAPAGYTSLLNREGDTGDSNLDATVLTSRTTDAEDGCDIVQFTAFEYYVEETEQFLLVDVMRFGSLQGSVTVMYETEDGSATEVADYKEARGMITFAENEHTHQIRLELRTVLVWRTSLNFRLKLSEPNGCQLGLYLNTCIVHIIDLSPFPSDKFKETILGCSDLKAQVKSLPKWPMLWELCKLIFFSAGSVRWLTLLVLVLDQMKNMYHLLLTYTAVYLVNVVLNTHAADDQLLLPTTRTRNLYVIGGVYVVPMILLHAWDYAKTKIDLHGRVTHWMRVNLFRKYLNFSDESRELVDSGTIAMALHSDTEKLASGYTHLMELVQIFGKIASSLYFTYHDAPRAVKIVIFLPTITLVWCFVREKCLLSIKGAAKPTSKMLSVIHDAGANFDLYETYMQRPFVVDKFAETAGEVQGMSRARALFVLNSHYFIEWMSPIMVAFYICTVGPVVIAGDQTLGAFLATVKVIHDVNGGCLVLFGAHAQVVSTFKPLGRLTVLFNRPTSLIQRKGANRERRHISADHISQLKERCSDGKKLSHDLVNISLTKVSMKARNGDPILNSCTASAEQGKIIALAGSHKSGKHALMNLLTHKSYPTEGQVSIPIHLRVILVTEQPVIFAGSAYRNLVLGLPAGRTPDHARIRKILEQLEMTDTLEHINERLDSSADQNPQHCMDMSWTHFLSKTEGGKYLFHLARALIANPEVLVLEKPFVHFGETDDEVVLKKALREHVENRGMGLPPLQGSHVRRPRTMFYSMIESRHLAFADHIWSMEGCDEEGWSITEYDSKKYDLSQVTMCNGTASSALGARPSVKSRVKALEYDSLEL